MDPLFTLRPLLAYSDAMNRALLAAAEPLSAEQLDRPIDMGMGSLRKTFAHILVGETVWLSRQQGEAETKWIPHDPAQSPAAMQGDFDALWPRRDALLANVTLERLEAEQRYRDSSGGLFRASLHEMLMQGVIHSGHHRAQAVHMLKRVGGSFVEMDFMYSRRRVV